MPADDASNPDAPAGGNAAPGAEADLDARLASLPARPGVYLLRDAHDKVIYVGKAKSLRSRVRSYFRGGDERAQVRFLVTRVTSFETLVTSNEKEAFILENNLIKQYKPRYNIRLKDDKSYVSVKVEDTAGWPRLVVTRKLVRDGSRYLGPFSSAWSVRETLGTLRKIFPLRSCSDAVLRNRSRPCIEYQIKRCPAPCCLEVDPDEYGRNLAQTLELLEGKNREIVRALEARMHAAADAERFEEAGKLRDQIRAIETTVERQQAVAHWGVDQDAFGIYREGGFVEVQVLLVRAGRLTGNQNYSFEDFELPDDEVLSAVLTQFYEGERPVPDTILVPIPLEDAEVRAEYLAERKGRQVEILCPQRGAKLRLVEMARENAAHSYAERRDVGSRRERMLEELQRRLHLRNAPKRIECFDISNIQGNLSVGSMVTFDEGEPCTARYRRYRIRTVEGADDFASMYEVLTRRYRRAREERDFPDLLVVDGGKGQLNVAVEVMRELEIDGVDVISLAKMHVEQDARASAVVRSEERVFLPGRKNPVVLRRNSTALFLLQRVRDEAHRFAITYHRELRRRDRLRSRLEDIEGVGPGRRRALLRHFGSLKRLRAASVEEIAAVPGISSRLAAEIRVQLAVAEDEAAPPAREGSLPPDDGSAPPGV
ncbi:MAG TPA: excinuclease ABC subunit UvrC [Candidatus Binatia bacterium]|jgi:excinuclease ABC subunit C